MMWAMMELVRFSRESVRDGTRKMKKRHTRGGEKECLRKLWEEIKPLLHGEDHFVGHILPGRDDLTLHVYQSV